MMLKDEGTEFRVKVMAGIHKAVKQLVVTTAEKNGKLVIADKDGNVLTVPAKELLYTVSQDSNLIESK